MVLMMISVSCNKDALTISEGVYGTVIERYGDWMPMIGGNRDHGERPVRREVYVYEKAYIQDLRDVFENGPYVAPEKMPLQFIAKTSSSKKGFYQIQIPAGEYSIFILDNGKFQISGGDGYGWMCPLVIEAGQVKEVNLLLDHAVY